MLVRVSAFCLFLMLLMGGLTGSIVVATASDTSFHGFSVLEPSQQSSHEALYGHSHDMTHGHDAGNHLHESPDRLPVTSLALMSMVNTPPALLSVTFRIKRNYRLLRPPISLFA
ncbi:hypothetical protein [Parendozoicomonas haliclonae]|nr:hypothetical protein [Parendozoicomonas haliclonae]